MGRRLREIASVVLRTHPAYASADQRSYFRLKESGDIDLNEMPQFLTSDNEEVTMKLSYSPRQSSSEFLFGEDVAAGMGSEDDVEFVDYKNVDLLRQLVAETDEAKTSRSKAQQQEIDRAIRNAREMGLLPYEKLPELDAYREALWMVQHLVAGSESNRAEMILRRMVRGESVLSIGATLGLSTGEVQQVLSEVQEQVSSKESA